MSIRWMYAELADAHIDGTAVLLVLDLALHADNDSICRTSLETLAGYCGLSERKLRKHLRTLHQHGYLTVTQSPESVNSIRVHCMQMLMGDPAVDGSPVIAEDSSKIGRPLPHLSAPHTSPNWN